MNKHIAASVMATALISALAGAASAAPTHPTVLRSPAATEQNTTAVGMPRTAPPPASQPDASGTDRTFHPDYAKALTPDQMRAAWDAEIARVFQPPVAGGG